MSRFCGYIFACAHLPLALAAPASAPDAPPAPTGTTAIREEAVPDYTPAFARLFALGLPDSRGGALLKAPPHGDHDYFGNNPPPALPGYAWRMPAPEGSPPDYIIAGVARFASEGEARPPAFHGLQALLQNPTRFAPSVKIPKENPFTPADLRTELETVTKGLTEWKTKRGDTAERHDMSERLAAYLIFAAQAWRHGQAEAANRLAHLALTSTRRGRFVARRASGAVAEARWDRFMDAWTRSAPDNRALAAELEAITTRFAQGWNRTGPARLLLSRIRNAPPPAPLALPGHNFTEAQLGFARDLLALRTPPPAVDWLADEKPPGAPRVVLRSARSATAEKSPVIDFLRAQGVEALPLLAALADDHSVTPCVPPADPNRTRYSSPDYIQDDEDERAESSWQIANELSRWENRPRTRGEIARGLLGSLSGLNLENGDSDAFTKRVLDAYATIKAEGRLGIFLKTARAGSEWERRQGWQSALAAAASDADFARLESAMLACAEKYELFEAVLPQYLRKRTGGAAPFFKTFTAVLREELDEYDDAHFALKSANRRSFSEDNEARPDQTREAALAAFDAKVAELAPLVAVAEKLPADRRLARMLDDLEKASPSGPGLNEQEFTDTVAELGDPWEKIVPDLLTRAAKTPREELLWRYLNLTQTAVAPDESPEEEPAPPSPEVIRSRFTRLLPQWRALLDSAAGKTRRTVTILVAADQIHGDARDMGRFHESMRHLEPEEQLAFMTARFDARAAGTPPPDWPSADRVTSERLAALSAELGALPPAALRARYAALTADERVAWTASLEKNPDAITAATRAARDTIASVKAEPGDRDAERFITEHKLSGYVGRTINPASVREWVVTAVAQKPDRSAIRILITQRPVGIALRVMSLDADNARRRRGARDDADQVLAQFHRETVSADGTRGNRSAATAFTPGAAVDGDSAKEFWKAIATLSDNGQRTANLHLSLTIPKGKPPAIPAP